MLVLLLPTRGTLSAAEMGKREMPEILRGVKRVLFYGDSLTDGSSYPDYVVSTLNREFPDAGFEILNSAVCGDTAADLRKRFKEDVADRNSDLIIICIGTNDCVRKRTVADYEADLTFLVTEVLRADAGVILMTPSHFGDKERETRFQGNLEVIRKVAATHELIVADAHAEFLKREKEGREMLGADGIHHGKHGFEGMARAVLDALGLRGAEIDMRVRPWPHLLADWETSAPIPLSARGKKPFDPDEAKGWRPYDRQAAIEKQPWWDSPFPARGAWMPFAVEKPKERSIAYGRTTYRAAKACRAELQIGGSRPLVAWLNGKEVWRGGRPHGYHPNADRVTVRLQAGDNRFVVVSNYMAFLGVRELGLRN